MQRAICSSYGKGSRKGKALTGKTGTRPPSVSPTGSSGNRTPTEVYNRSRTTQPEPAVFRSCPAAPLLPCLKSIGLQAIKDTLRLPRVWKDFCVKRLKATIGLQDTTPISGQQITRPTAYGVPWNTG